MSRALFLRIFWGVWRVRGVGGSGGEELPRSPPPQAPKKSFMWRLNSRKVSRLFYLFLAFVSVEPKKSCTARRCGCKQWLWSASAYLTDAVLVAVLLVIEPEKIFSLQTTNLDLVRQVENNCLVKLSVRDRRWRWNLLS